MKISIFILILSFLGSLTACNENQVAARREGLIPIQEGNVSTFGLESIKE